MNNQKIAELAKELQQHLEDFIEWKQEESIYSIAALTNRIVMLAREELFPSQVEKEDKDES
jgi:hypothetical protein